MRKLITRLSIPSALLLVLLVAIFSLTAAQDTPTATPPANGEPKRDSVSITVYNQGTALVKDRRTFTFEAGENQINFTDVASTIDATSVNFKSLTDPVTYVIEQNYAYDLVDTSALLARYIDQEISVTMTDAAGTVYRGTLLSGSYSDIILRQENGEVVVLSLAETRDVRFPQLPDGLITRPTLRWLVQAGASGDQQVELTYLAGGMNWTADYNLLLASDNKALDLNGWVTLTNTSGTGYKDAQLKLVAGDVNRVVDAVAADGMIYEERAMEAPAPTASVEQREFNEYKLYEVKRLVTIGNNETKQVEFVSGTNIPATTFFVYDASVPYYYYGSPIRDQFYGNTGVTTVSNYLEFTTGKENGIDAALPAGRVRVYQEDTDGAALLIGENTIQHTPKGETIQLYLGNAFDLVGERIQTNFIIVSSNVIQETYEIHLRNRKENDSVQVRVPEHLSRWSEWQILNSSIDYTKKDSSTIEFRADVPAQGEV
ncbi:MAG TPA: hypothetical protein VHL11_24585, partial [Phototrophicaceae bacterium]|nr:hypothetical protein [Phototrophicaceae bacterium]